MTELEAYRQIDIEVRSYQKPQEAQMISTMVEYLQGIQMAKEAIVPDKNRLGNPRIRYEHFTRADYHRWQRTCFWGRLPPQLDYGLLASRWLCAMSSWAFRERTTIGDVWDLGSGTFGAMFGMRFRECFRLCLSSVWVMLELCLILCFDYIVVSVLVSAFHIVLRMYHRVLRCCRTDNWDLRGVQELCIRRSISYFIYSVRNQLSIFITLPSYTWFVHWVNEIIEPQNHPANLHRISKNYRQGSKRTTDRSEGAALQRHSIYQ
jgi:hypothetical protein